MAPALKLATAMPTVTPLPCSGPATTVGATTTRHEWQDRQCWAISCQHGPTPRAHPDGHWRPAPPPPPRGGLRGWGGPGPERPGPERRRGSPRIRVTVLAACLDYRPSPSLPRQI